MALNFLVLQHIDWETPGIFLLDAARKLGIHLEIVRIYRQAAPDSADFDALLLLGGPPNVHEENRYPFLREEKRLLKAWLAMDRPCLGFCLGHQLLADALGAEIGTNFMPGTGFTKGHLTHSGSEHPIFRGITSPLSLFKWHSQSVQTPLPRELLMLATSSQCVIEAFGVAGRPHIIGLQCDNHAAHPNDVRSWLHHDNAWLRGLPEGETLSRTMVDEAEQRTEEMQSVFLQLMRNFATLVEEKKTSP